MPSYRTTSPPETPLQILHLTYGADAGGLTQYIVTLARAMQSRGHMIQAAGDDGAWIGEFENSGVPYRVIPLKAGLRGFHQSVRTMRRELASQQVDVLHTHYRRATLLGRRLQKVARAPLLYSLHLSHLDLRGHRRWLSDFGDVTHAASADAVQWLQRDARVPPERIVLIPHGVDTQKFQPPTTTQRSEARASLGLEPNDIVGGFIGRLDDPKNEHWLLDLLHAARERLPRLKILFGGEGPRDASLRAKAKSLGLDNRVQILGRVDPRPVYHAIDALLLPSWREGFSLVCAEAMACGVPCLRTRTSGVHELIDEGITGVSTPIDHDAFISAGLAFFSDVAALRRMGVESRERIVTRFEFETQVTRTIELYEQLRHPTSPRSPRACSRFLCQNRERATRGGRGPIRCQSFPSLRSAPALPMKPVRCLIPASI